MSVKSDKSYAVTLLLCYFLGSFGAHRFYVGKTGTAIAQLLTLGGCGVWTLIDYFLIIFGAFTDDEGREINNASY